MKLPAHKAALYLTHNEHKNYYQPLAEWMEDQCQGEEKPFGNAEQEAKCLATDELWALQWYVNTPVGFNLVWAATLEELLQFANEDD